MIVSFEGQRQIALQKKEGASYGGTFFFGNIIKTQVEESFLLMYSIAIVGSKTLREVNFNAPFLFACQKHLRRMVPVDL